MGQLIPMHFYCEVWQLIKLTDRSCSIYYIFSADDKIFTKDHTTTVIVRCK